MQMQADLAGTPVIRPECVESTAMGAAYLAGLATGFWKDTEEIRRNWTIDSVFKPKMNDRQRRTSLDGWHKAVERSFGWARKERSRHFPHHAGAAFPNVPMEGCSW